MFVPVLHETYTTYAKSSKGGHMTLALVFSFCCLVCSAVNDLFFKFFARKPRSRGLFVMTVGIVGTVCMAFLPDKFSGNIPMTLFWGSVCGIFSAVGNILLIESMTYLSAGICSTIYRLNLALVVPFSVLFFNEKLFWYQYVGVGLAIMAVLAFLPSSGNSGGQEKKSKSLALPMIMIITASIFRAGLGLSCKGGPLMGASTNGINFIIEVYWIVSGLAYYLIKERSNADCRMDRKLAGYGTLSGVMVAAILFFMMKALNSPGGGASIVLTIAQMSFILTFILSIIILKEKVTMLKIGAIICGIGAMILLSWR